MAEVQSVVIVAVNLKRTSIFFRFVGQYWGGRDNKHAFKAGVLSWISSTS